MQMLKVCLLLGFLVVFGVTAAWGTTLHVPTGYTTIQAAINAAVNLDTVLVDTGVYHGSVDLMGKDLVITSHYLFSADTTDILNTVLDGDSSGSVVVMTSGESEAALVLGFTIRNGSGHLYQPGYGDFYVGGGFYLINASPRIRSNVIQENYALDGGGGIFSDGGDPVIELNTIVNNATGSPGCGAGMLLKNSDEAVVDSNYIEFNFAGHGGGIALKHSHATITRNVISYNTAMGDGGGMRLYTESNPTIINNTISHNCAAAYSGGGMQVVDGSAPIFMNNIISYTACGGGFAVAGICAPVLSYNLFHENTGGDYLNVLPGTGDLTGNPAYVGGTPYDYHLTAPSAAISSGNPDPQYNDPDGTRNDCGAFYYPSGPATPVVLAAFTASSSLQGVTLTWTTASEIESYGWVVQRMDEAGSWAAVSPLIAAHGSSVEPHDYTYTDATAQAGCAYRYRLEQIDLDGSATYSPEVTATVPALALDFGLQPNYPNPFNPETAIVYTLPEATPVYLAVYDAAGRFVQELASGLRPAGTHQVTWNAGNLPSGTYLCRLQAGSLAFTRPLTLIK
ncbi:MAG: T9SS C-terminal target domain-containing protein [Candidatus Zixiibacteriota bacterium]|nr:MAG: T9SS C-terminal target domain-containing protein [candidate division Zixibacteria bacterium]